MPLRCVSRCNLIMLGIQAFNPAEFLPMVLVLCFCCQNKDLTDLFDQVVLWLKTIRLDHSFIVKQQEMQELGSTIPALMVKLAAALPLQS